EPGAKRGGRGPGGPRGSSGDLSRRGDEYVGAVPAGPAGRSRLILEHGLEVELDPDALADQEAAGLQRLVPGDVEVLTVDVARGHEPGAQVAPRVDGHALELDVEGGGPCAVADRQVAHDLEAVPDRPHRRAAVRHEGEALDVQEVGRAQVLVASAL